MNNNLTESIKKSLNTAKPETSTKQEIEDGFIFLGPNGEIPSEDRIYHNALVVSKLVNVICNITNDESTIKPEEYQNFNYYNISSDERLNEIKKEITNKNVLEMIDRIKSIENDEQIDGDRIKICGFLQLALKFDKEESETVEHFKKLQCELLEVVYMMILEFIDNYYINPQQVLNALKLNDYLFDELNKKEEVKNENDNKEEDKNKTSENVESKKEEVKNENDNKEEVQTSENVESKNENINESKN